MDKSLELYNLWVAPPAKKRKKDAREAVTEQSIVYATVRELEFAGRSDFFDLISGEVRNEIPESDRYRFLYAVYAYLQQTLAFRADRFSKLPETISEADLSALSVRVLQLAEALHGFDDNENVFHSYLRRRPQPDPFFADTACHFLREDLLPAERKRIATELAAALCDLQLVYGPMQEVSERSALEPFRKAGEQTQSLLALYREALAYLGCRPIRSESGMAYNPAVCRAQNDGEHFKSFDPERLVVANSYCEGYLLQDELILKETAQIGVVGNRDMVLPAAQKESASIEDADMFRMAKRIAAIACGELSALQQAGGADSVSKDFGTLLRAIAAALEKTDVLAQSCHILPFVSEVGDFYNPHRHEGIAENSFSSHPKRIARSIRCGYTYRGVVVWKEQVQADGE